MKAPKTIIKNWLMSGWSYENIAQQCRTNNWEIPFEINIKLDHSKFIPLKPTPQISSSKVSSPPKLIPYIKPRDPNKKRRNRKRLLCKKSICFRPKDRGYNFLKKIIGARKINPFLNNLIDKEIAKLNTEEEQN